jgi:hypothetical protein
VCKNLHFGFIQLCATVHFCNIKTFLLNACKNKPLRLGCTWFAQLKKQQQQQQQQQQPSLLVPSKLG